MFSPLITCQVLSPNHSGKRTHTIDRITIHCAVGQLTAKRIGEILQPAAKKASANYAVGTDGSICGIVPEEYRSWCSSNAANDHRAITIETACELSEPYTVNSTAMNALIKLVADCCKRNGIAKLNWVNNKNAPGNMTVHRWFASTACPGTYLMGQMGNIAEAVNKILSGNVATVAPGAKLFKVQCGAFKDKNNAVKLQDKLKMYGYSTYMPIVNGLYKVQVGAFQNRANAESLLQNLKYNGFNGFITT